MTDAELLFFNRHPDALPLYLHFLQRMRETLGDFTVKVQKTQISFSNRRMFACVSFLPVRSAKDRPAAFITLTLGLPERILSSRIDGISEPYPGRFTHHILLSSCEEIDSELLSWGAMAYRFSARQ